MLLSHCLQHSLCNCSKRTEVVYQNVEALQQAHQVVQLRAGPEMCCLIRKANRDKPSCLQSYVFS